MKKKKPKEKVSKNNMTKYHYADINKPYITGWVNVSYEITREHDPDDRWSGEDKSGSLDDYGLSLGQPQNKNRYYDNEKSFNKSDIGFMPKVKDIVYLVIEDYDEGDSFGHTDHSFKPFHIFKTEEEAIEWTRSDNAISCMDSDYFGGHNEWIIKECIVK